MSQSSTKNQSLRERILSFAEPIWIVCRWIWVTIILAISIGAFINLLSQAPQDFFKGSFIIFIKLLLSQRIIIAIAALFIIVTTVSGIIVFREKRAAAAREDPALKYIEAVSVQLENIAINSAEHNKKFVEYQHLIQQMTQSQTPQRILRSFYDLYQKDLLLKQETLNQGKELNTNLKELIAEVRAIRYQDNSQHSNQGVHNQGASGLNKTHTSHTIGSKQP